MAEEEFPGDLVEVQWRFKGDLVYLVVFYGDLMVIYGV